MQTKLVQKDESIEFVINGKFVFCKELNKGFIKTDLSSLNISDYAFQNVVTVIEGLDYDSIINTGVNSVTFENGEILVSERVEEKLKNELALINDETLRTNLITSRRQHRKYFLESNLLITNNTQSSQMIL